MSYGNTPSAKRDNPVLFREQELTVFYYRSDNLSDEQKERIIDFRNYDDGGKWYVLLDEAHKGDREESKRQHIYSILSRNGFLFNFSATFTDVPRSDDHRIQLQSIRIYQGRATASTSRFCSRSFERFVIGQDYNNDEKQKIVLKSLLMLTHVRKFSESLRQVKEGLYHRPLML